MKNATLILFTILFLASCKNKGKDSESTIQTQDTLTHLYGNWVGLFLAKTYKDENKTNESRINILIKKIDHNLQVTGESIVLGKRRPFQGTVKMDGSLYQFSLREPGDDKTDGVFDFKIDYNAEGPEKLKGYWTAFNKKLNVTVRSFTLEQKEFKYDQQLMLPEDRYADFKTRQTRTTLDTITYDQDSTLKPGEKPQVEEYTESVYPLATEAVYTINASAKVLKAEELKNLRKLDLEIIRNTIYARHGYIFKNPKARQFFDGIDWYIPVNTAIEKDLTTVEKQNIQLIKRFENYATNYYDSFGR